MILQRLTKGVINFRVDCRIMSFSLTLTIKCIVFKVKPQPCISHVQEQQLNVFKKLFACFFLFASAIKEWYKHTYQWVISIVMSNRNTFTKDVHHLLKTLSKMASLCKWMIWEAVLKQWSLLLILVNPYCRWETSGPVNINHGIFNMNHVMYIVFIGHGLVLKTWLKSPNMFCKAHHVY